MLNTLTLENEKLFGEGFKNKSKVPVYSTSRNLLHVCPHEKHFSWGHKRSLPAGYAGNNNIWGFLCDYTVHDQFFILNLPELTLEALRGGGWGSN